MYVQLIIAVFVILFKAVNSEECIQVKNNPCKCVSRSGSYSIDLLSIVGNPPRFKQIPNPKVPEHEYSYSPCKSFTEGFCKDVAVCQSKENITTGTVTYYSLGTQTSAVMSGDAELGTLKITYWSNSSHDKQNRTSNVNITCSDAQEPRLEVLGESSPDSHLYNFVLHTHLACVMPGGLSTGSILLIVCLVLVAVYLLVGIMYMRFYGGARGLEQIPNIEFWKDFPSLVKDGVTFTMNCCRVDTAYSQI